MRPDEILPCFNCRLSDLDVHVVELRTGEKAFHRIGTVDTRTLVDDGVQQIHRVAKIKYHCY